MHRHRRYGAVGCGLWKLESLRSDTDAFYLGCGSSAGVVHRHRRYGAVDCGLRKLVPLRSDTDAF